MANGVSVRIYVGDSFQGNATYEVEMPVIPRVDEVIVFASEKSEYPYKVVDVAYYITAADGDFIGVKLLVSEAHT